MYSNTFTLFSLLFMSSLLLGNGLGLYSNQVAAQKTNEADVNADIEQENKCKKDTECENENELNNGLGIPSPKQKSNEKDKELDGVEGDEATLTIVKTLECFDEEDTNLEVPCTPSPGDFQITVGGNNPSPSTFSGSDSGTEVTIGPGPYNVTEIPFNYDARFVEVSGDCGPNGEWDADGLIMFGDINSGEQQTCNIKNIVYQPVD